MSADAVFSEQKRLGEEIDRFKENYGKDGKARKCKESYFVNKISSLKELFKEFDERHKDIEQTYADKVQEHEYFTNNYYNAIKNIYDTTLAKIETELNEFKGVKSSTPHGSPTQNTAKLGELIADKDFIKKMLELLLDRVLKCANLDKKTWSFNLQRAEQYWANYEVVTSTIKNDHNEEYVKMQLMQERNNTYDAYQTITTSIEEKLASAEDDDEPRINDAELTLNQTMIAFSESLKQIREPREELKLPRMQIPKFSGSFDKWPEFRDLYIALVHSRKNIPKVQKLQYLKANLEGEAGDIIRHLQITEANYDNAWKLIEKRFNNKKMLVTNYLNRLFKQPAIEKENADALKKMLDGTKEILLSLENMGEPIAHWNTIIVFILTQRLPPQSYRLWEEAAGEEISNLEKLETFLEARFRILENLELKRDMSKAADGKSSQYHYNKNAKGNQNQQGTSAKSFNVDISKCALCNSPKHNIFKCFQFRDGTATEKQAHVKRLQLCSLCLGSHGTHHVKNCTSNWKCHKCNGNHNTTIHVDKTVSTNTIIPEVANPAETHAECNNCTDNDGSSVLLATALIKVNNIVLRALLDQGSTVSFITENAVQALNLERRKDALRVLGIGGTTNTSVQGSVLIELRPHFKSNFVCSAKAYILPQITTLIPSEKLISKATSKFNHLQLADPNLNNPKRVDVLLGADVLASIMLSGIICGQPLAQETALGWIVSGHTSKPPSTTQVCLSVSLEQQLEKFWKIEEPDNKEEEWSIEETAAENVYKHTHARDPETGRYSVQLPFKPGGPILGRSRNIAIANFRQLEKKFKKNTIYKDRYVHAMNQYFKMGHAKPATKPERCYEIQNENGSSNFNCYYMPHLAVIKDDSSTTKTRIVFDASRKSTNGISLNDTLMTGPVIQSDIVDKLINFRKHKFVFTCDAEKMYLQILVHDSHLPFQRFVWREHEHEEIKDYCVSTVVFGQSSAPFLAIRTFKQIAIDYKDAFPLGAYALENEFYVDDLLAGESSVEKAIQKQSELKTILGKAGIKLRKWAANKSDILADIAPEDRESDAAIDIDNIDKVVKTLGLYWNNSTDSFKYKVIPLPDCPKICTKRQILSESAKLFDPIGWVQPIVITAKIILQDLWAEKMQWDDPLCEAISKKWSAYKIDLQKLTTLEVPRWLEINEPDDKFELHAYADASEKAYGAVVYLRNTSQRTVHIVMAKSRVAPLKKKTLARLELCAAVVAVNLVQKISKTLKLKHCKAYGWSDSTIALAWINKPSNTWKSFVAHRVAKIQEVIQSNDWHHVTSAQNPADIISRGCEVDFLRRSSLWWHGPSWLSDWQNTAPNQFETDEEKVKQTCAVAICNSILPCTQTGILQQYADISPLLSRISSFGTLIGAVGWTNRAVDTFLSNKNKTETSITLSNEEKRAAHTLTVKLVQAADFATDIEAINKGRLPPSSKLHKLDPKWDENGILRVGGRLSHANLPVAQKHPIILPYDHNFTNMVIRKVHSKCFHAGNRATLASIRLEYWIIKGNAAVKRELSKCVICKRFRAQVNTQLMGQLPQSRVNISRPFTHTGCDLAGPVMIKSAKGRGIKTTKGYLIVFVCMATKAIHIELASDMSSAAFIGALKRLIARRGMITDMYSDNGRNMVGANSTLIRENIKSDVDILKFVKTEQIKWHFLPPYSPHMGGLWEAAVKSIKLHLHRVFYGESLTFEEMSTVLCQIESCLNSRPLLPLTESIEDINVITPGHFIIGNALTAPSEPSYLELNPNHLKRWQYCSRLFQSFWKRWSTDYLNQMRQRTKWNKNTRSVAVGDIVVIKEDNTPPNSWRMGRIESVHPGVDGLTRAVTLRTQTGVTKRNITRLVTLVSDRQSEVQDEITTTQTKTTPSAREQRLLRRNRNKMSLSASMFVGIIMSSLLIVAVFGNTVQVSKLNDKSPSIFFEKIGPVQYVKNYWSISSPHNRSDYDAEILQASTNMHSMISVCQKINKTLPSCHHKLRYLQQKLSKIATNNEYMEIQAPHRKKREVVTIVGTIAAAVGGGIVGATGKYLYDKMFGTKNELDQILQNEEILNNHLINETSLLNDTVHAFKAQHRTINANMEELSKIANAEANDIGKTWMRQEFQFWLYEVSAQFDEIISYQDMIMNPGSYMSELFPSKHLAPLLNKIATQLQHGESLPSSSSLLDLGRTASVWSRITNETFEFNIKFPLVSECQYTLYQMHFLPVASSNKKMTTIVNQYDYFAINCNNNTVSLTQSFIDRCIPSASYMCPSDIQYQTADECNEKWFQQTAASNACKYKDIPAETVWSSTSQGLLFSTVSDTELVVNCANFSVAVHIPKVSLLYTADNCEITWNNTKIKTKPQPSSRSSPFVSTTSIKMEKYHKGKSFKLKEDDETEKIAEIERKIQALNTQERKFDPHNVHHYVAPYALVIFILAAVYYKSKSKPIRAVEHTNFTINNP